MPWSQILLKNATDVVMKLSTSLASSAIVNKLSTGGAATRGSFNVVSRTDFKQCIASVEKSACLGKEIVYEGTRMFEAVSNSSVRRVC